MTAIAEEPTRTEQKTITKVAGVVDLVDGRGFLRTGGYRRDANDIPITQAQVRQHALRSGDHIEGTAGARQAKSGQGSQGSQSNQARNKARQDTTLLTVDSVNGRPAAEARNRPSFDDLTPVYPNQRFRLEDGDPSRTARIIDLVSPIGKGQRGLIVAPPKAGKTTVLKTIAHAIAVAYPEVHLMLVLVGERPEEVTDLRRTVRGEVVSSTFDQSPTDHIKAAELAIERAKRLAELGRDVVVMLDSLTRLGRAYNLAAPATSRTLSGGVAAAALQPPRQFLGAARCLEEGGSLTILSTALIDTGSLLDNVLFEEFKGTGNMELRLRRDLAEKRLFPAIDPVPSGTRREDLLMNPEEHAAVVSLRRALAALDSQHALELLLDKTAAPNKQFLREVSAAR
ncbi:MAG TPA: transcription termination factor Rho [Trebonia sp.]|nr:transcription termination factor Rho [Trebonia sp.]